MSCSKNKDVPAFSMNAKIVGMPGDTSDYVNNNCKAQVIGTTLIIQGLGSTSLFPVYPYIQITIPNWYGVQTRYFFDSSNSNNHAQYIVDATTVKPSWYGSVIINSVSDRMISGHFDFMTTDTIYVTNGGFVAQIVQ
jgi:hypothetical protein